ncbi:MAG TPA: right-handed parallel beta-helix repeat-containing protein [Planctomycetota bacterium]
MRLLGVALLLALSEPAASGRVEGLLLPQDKAHPGLSGPIGPVGPPTRVKTLLIDKPGVYENYLVDAEFAEVDAVRIKADGVTLRNCEIRNGARDGIEVYASDVVIENCRIHHFLNGSFAPHLDAHGITGQPTRLTIRNCEIGYVSGDAVQFDPGRKPWTDVVIENCVLFTGPLPEDAGGFKKGERPGENAVDTKQRTSNPRSRLTIRDTVCHGWRQPAQIENMSAVNLKNHVDVKLDNCVFYDNEIALRLRGPDDAGELGGAWVSAENCAFYATDVAVRLEDRIEKTRLVNPRYGADVKERVTGERKTGPGTRIDPGSDAPPLATVLGRD